MFISGSNIHVSGLLYTMPQCNKWRPSTHTQGASSIPEKTPQLIGGTFSGDLVEVLLGRLGHYSKVSLGWGMGEHHLVTISDVSVGVVCMY